MEKSHYSHASVARKRPRAAWCAALALAVVLGLLLAGPMHAASPQAAPRSKARLQTWLWAVGLQASPEQYARFQLVVLDGLEPLPQGLSPARQASGAPLLLGSLRLAEAEAASPLLALAQACGAASLRSDGTALLDLGNAAWREKMLERVIPQALARGYDGLFLDALDAGLAQAGDAATLATRRAALLEFLRSLRARFPGVLIGMNRGLDILPEAAPWLDFLLLEELSTECGPGASACGPVNAAALPGLRQAMVAGTRAATAANPALTVLTLDFADPAQGELIREAIGYARGKGFVPYVGPPGLDRILTHTLDP